MIARKCDRCGKLYEFYIGSVEFKNKTRSNGIMFIDRDTDGKYFRRKDIDLCFKCMQELVNWFKENTDHDQEQNH